MLSKIGFFILETLSLLPMSFLYKISDLTSFFLLKILGYRKEVVVGNIEKSFPLKTDQEVDVITNRFYTNFTDFIIETIKTIKGDYSSFKDSVKFNNTNVINKVIANNNTIILCGHVFNWELFATVYFKDFLPKNTKIYAVYRALENEYFDKKIRQSRSKCGVELIETKDVFDKMANASLSGKKNIFLFVADQTPHSSKIKYCLNFLGQKTPVFNGFDFLARKHKCAVLYSEYIKLGRQNYAINFSEITQDSTDKKTNEITDIFFSKLERTIKNNPDNWLWTHRRWKYQDFCKN